MARERFPRPPPEHPDHPEAFVLPWGQRQTIRQVLGVRQLGLRVRCRACGRDSIITPNGLLTMFGEALDVELEVLARRLRCDTCEAMEAQVGCWPIHKPTARLTYVRRRHWREPLKVDG